MSDFGAYTIAIVGSGFSGTATAIHLLRHQHDRRIRVLLIERGAEFGRGLAYARSRYAYLLNVPASRMSATASDPGEFVRFARQANVMISGEDFLPRSVYGDYLQHLIETAVAGSSPSGSSLECLRAEVVDLATTQGRKPIALTLADGSYVKADAVVLALGTPPARLPARIRCTAAWPMMRKDPWTESRAPVGGRPLLVIGTGLTMVDVVCAAADADPDIEIHAISRHGLLPHSQTTFRLDALTNEACLLAGTGGSILGLITRVRCLIEQAERRGGDWREVITIVRREAPAIWRGLSLVERARFLRHARAYWDIHRHRIPAPVLEKLDALRATRRLRVHAGRLLSIECTNDGVLATWLGRGSKQRQTLHAAEVVNCTGADYDVTHSAEPLWQALLTRGMAIPDALKLGIRTGHSGALVGRDGSTSRPLFYVGPMLRADHWEATAVGELRAHAEQLAQYLLQNAPIDSPRRGPSAGQQQSLTGTESR